MKCKNCGADYSASALFCPYCRVKNPVGVEWENETAAANRKKDAARREMLRRTPAYVLNCVLNTILGIGAACVVLTFAAALAAAGIEAVHAKRVRGSASVAEAERLYREQDFAALDAYISEHELGAEEAYGKYREVTVLISGASRYKEQLMRYYEQAEKGFPSGGAYHTVQYAFEESQKIISRGSFYYDIEYAENEPVYEEYRGLARRFLGGELLLTAEEIEQLSGVRYLSTSESDDWMTLICKRKGWTFQ